MRAYAGRWLPFIMSLYVWGELKRTIMWKITLFIALDQQGHPK